MAISAFGCLRFLSLLLLAWRKRSQKKSSFHSLDILCHSKHPNTFQFTPIYMSWGWPYIFPYTPVTFTPQPTFTGWTSFWEEKRPWKEENRAASWAQNHVFSTEREPHFPCAILVLSLFLVTDTEYSKKLFLKSHWCCSPALGQGVSHWGDIFCGVHQDINFRKQPH